MKIGPTADPLSPASSTSAAEARPAAAAKPPAESVGARHGVDGAAASAGAGSTVALSSTASTLLAGGTPSEFDTAKVALMRDAITRGTFKVDPEAIADKLIANAEELLSKVQRG